MRNAARFFSPSSGIGIVTDVDVPHRRGKRFLGEFDEAVDPKGRMKLEKAFRDRLGSSFAMAIGEVGCVCLYTEDEWEKLLDTISRFDPQDKGRRWYSRLLFSTAAEELDCEGGRIVIPVKLRKLAGLDDKALVVGAGDRIEIWNPGEFRVWFENQDTYESMRKLTLQRAYETMTGASARSIDA